MSRIRLSFALAMCVGLALATAGSQAPAADVGPRISYPSARTVDVVDDYHGTKVADPYRWLEDLDSAAVADWVKAENAVTTPYLAALPGRGALVARITALYNFPRTGAPFWEGGRWFYVKNSGLQKQAFGTRAPRSAEPRSCCSIRTSCRPTDRSALVGAVPVARRHALRLRPERGRIRLGHLHVRDARRARTLADVVKLGQVRRSVLDEGRQGVLLRPLSGAAGQARRSRPSSSTRRSTTTCWARPSRPTLKIYERADHPMLVRLGGTDETGRYLFVLTHKGTDKNELYLEDLATRSTPTCARRFGPSSPATTPTTSPLGVAGRQAVPAAWTRTRRSEDRRGRHRDARAGELDDGDPRGRHADRGRVARRRHRSASLTLQDVASDVRSTRSTARTAREVTLPGLGTATRAHRAASTDRRCSTCSRRRSAAVDGVRLRRHGRHEPAVQAAAADVRPGAVHDRARVLHEQGRHTRADVHHLPQGPREERARTRRCSTPTAASRSSPPPSFRPDVLAWLERGGVYAIANTARRRRVRRGVARGRACSRRSRTCSTTSSPRPSTWSREKYTSPATLGDQGRVERRPAGRRGDDAAAGSVRGRGAAVGVMDMLRYDKFTGGAAWATEYGSSSDPKAVRVPQAPTRRCTTSRPGRCYPATLVTTADHDDRVVPSHSFKFAAQRCRRRRGARGRC